MAVCFLFSVTSHGGDCNNTVMGGGCSSQADAGAAPHMKSQPQDKPASKAADNAGPAAKPAANVKAVKVSNAAR